MTPEQRTVLDMRDRGMTRRDIAGQLGISVSAVKKRLERARRWQRLDPDVQARLTATGKTNIDNLHSFWDVRTDPDGGRTSLYYYLGQDDAASVEEMVAGAIEDMLGDSAPDFPTRPPPTGSNLLVVDIADLHIGKLSVRNETGVVYNRAVARHRAIEGTKALLGHAESHGIGRILFVLGNDLIHIDTPSGTTTSGTRMDTDGTIHQMVSDAVRVVSDCVEACANVADVDVVYVPSNHDWVMGYTIAMTVAAWFRNHPHVHTGQYNLSERHRKYYRFGNSLIGLSHGDGAKESELYPLMVTEGREHVSACQHLYWYVHHIHHKVRQRVTRNTVRSEKDLTGMTIIGSGAAGVEGDAAHIEYVRSPSASDGWHHRNGYINRQAVECFLHHPFDGQFARYTEWF